MESKVLSICAKLLCLAVSLTFVQTNTLLAVLSQVNLVSQSHIIEGYVDDFPDPVTYYKSDIVPIQGSCSSAYGIAQSCAGNLLVEASTIGGSYSYWAEAKSCYVFYPISNSVELTLYANYGWSAGPWGLSFSYALIDLDIATVISAFESYTSLIYSTHEWGKTELLSVNNNHLYELFLSVHADSFDGQDVSLAADVVPEPSTLLLLGLGAFMLRMKR